MVWLALMLAVRRPAALVVGLALGLSLVARLTAGEPALTERTLFEAGAAVVGVVAALYWHLAPRASASAAGTTLARWFRA